MLVLVHDPDSSPREQLARVREHSTVPVVLVTSNSSSDLVRWALDAGIADVVTLPSAPEAMLFAIEKAARNAREQGLSQSHGRVITVFSPKGGSGKSVVATNLAAAAAAKGKRRTLLVDLDLQFGDSAIMLGLQPRSTVRELIGTPADIDAEKLEVYTELHSTGLRVLPAPMNAGGCGARVGGSRCAASSRSRGSRTTWSSSTRRRSSTGRCSRPSTSPTGCSSSATPTCRRSRTCAWP